MSWAPPSQRLSACLERIDRREPEIRAFVSLARERARRDAEASDARWRARAPLSAIDGMTIAVKDVFETADMPTGQGSPLFEGTATGRDAACVLALREAGAVVLGKTTTTEFAASHPFAPTANPHDVRRTPGGSSSGSAAAVAAGMAEAALGTQVVGSVVRPASYCGCIGYKPTSGTLNRGGCFDTLSGSTVGVFATRLGTAWAVAREIAERVGGDPGERTLAGPASLPPPRRPARLAVLETEGWPHATPGARAAFETLAAGLRAEGIEIVTRRQDCDLDALEAEGAEALSLSRTIITWESRWWLEACARTDAGRLSESARARLARGRAMTLREYEAALARRARLTERFAQLSAGYDGFLALAATGAAPLGLGSIGDPRTNTLASMVGAPALSLPVLSDDSLPLGLQLLAGPGADAGLMALAGWLYRRSTGE